MGHRARTQLLRREFAVLVAAVFLTIGLLDLRGSYTASTSSSTPCVVLMVIGSGTGMIDPGYSCADANASSSAAASSAASSGASSPASSSSGGGGTQVGGTADSNGQGPVAGGAFRYGRDEVLDRFTTLFAGRGTGSKSILKAGQLTPAKQVALQTGVVPPARAVPPLTGGSAARALARVWDEWTRQLSSAFALPLAAGPSLPEHAAASSFWTDILRLFRSVTPAVPAHAPGLRGSQTASGSTRVLGLQGTVVQDPPRPHSVRPLAASATLGKAGGCDAADDCFSLACVPHALYCAAALGTMPLLRAPVAPSVQDVMQAPRSESLLWILLLLWAAVTARFLFVHGKHLVAGLSQGRSPENAANVRS